MEFDRVEVIAIVVNGVSFIAAFAAIAASVIMYQVTKKFGTGILAHGFKTIGTGVLFVAMGIIIDAVTSYFQFGSGNVYSAGVFLIKGLCFVAGTYTIVIGSKRTIDKLENLTK